MEEEKKLYPLKFYPIAETFPWGGDTLVRRWRKPFVQSDDQGRERRLEAGSCVAQSHEIADLGYRDSQVVDGYLAGSTLSEIMDMYVDRMVGEEVFGSYGRQFPVGVRFIDAHRRTPLLVHPDDEIAEQRYDFLGKAKMWYVVEAHKDARLFLGFSEDVDASQVYSKCLDGTVGDLLNEVKVKAGDCVYIAPGTVNAAQGVLLLEVGEASPLDFCLCNWGAASGEDEFDETFSLVEALDFIDYRKYVEPQRGEATRKDGFASVLVKKKEFTVNRIDLKEALHVSSQEAGSFSIYTCLSGKASVQLRDGEENVVCDVPAGQTVLMPSELNDFYLVPAQDGTVLIETLVEPGAEIDLYIDPDAEPTLGDE